jgi:hypothetical protein
MIGREPKSHSKYENRCSVKRFQFVTTNQTFFERLAACFAWAFAPVAAAQVSESPPFFRSSRTAFDFVCQARLAKDS